LYYHQDGLGTVTELTDINGSVAKAYAYDAYGNLLESPGTVEQPYTYTGREYDSESGLYFYRARYYDAGMGRFLQKDPVGLRGGINIYRYASNNPAKWRDPVGLWDFGNTFDAISNVFSVAGDGEYYGAAIGGGIGAIAGSPAGPPGVVGGAVFGSVVGGLIGFGFDGRCAGVLNCNEVVPLAGDYPKYGSCPIQDIPNGANHPSYTLSDTDYRNGPL
jgi:RHS repeat-associated protein